MTTPVRGLSSALLPGGSDGDAADLEEAIESQLAPDEAVRHTLQGSGDLVLERDGEEDHLAGPDGADPVVLVTDQHVIFTVESGPDDTIISVPYTEVGKVDVDDGFLRTTLVVKSWHEGTFRLRVSSGEDLSAAVSYISGAVECWQFATSKLEAARRKTGDVGEHFEEGRLGRGRRTREEVRELLDRARDAVDATDIEAVPSLLAEIEDLREHLHRTEVESRLSRANTLVTEAKYQTDAQAYAGAAEHLWLARDHLENARMLARKAEMAEPAVIEEGLETIERRLEAVRVQPTALAKQARERAERTGDLDVRIDALAVALDHYQDALTAAWGTDFEFAGDEAFIRFQIEVVVDDLIDARCARADEHLAAAADRRGAGETAPARNEVESAISHLEEAAALAAEFRAGDPDALEARIEKIRADVSGR